MRRHRRVVCDLRDQGLQCVSTWGSVRRRRGAGIGLGGIRQSRKPASRRTHSLRSTLTGRWVPASLSSPARWVRCQSRVTLITRRQQTLPSQATQHSADGRDPARLHPRFIASAGTGWICPTLRRCASQRPLHHTPPEQKTEDVRRRLAQLESMYPEELRHVHSIPTDDPSGIERYWLNRFAHKRLTTKGSRGEIFRLDPADVRAFRSRDYQ